MGALRAQTGTSPKARYNQLFQATEQARAKSEAARAALLDHIRDHNC